MYISTTFKIFCQVLVVSFPQPQIRISRWPQEYVAPFILCDVASLSRLLHSTQLLKVFVVLVLAEPVHQGLASGNRQKRLAFDLAGPHLQRLSR